MQSLHIRILLLSIGVLIILTSLYIFYNYLKKTHYIENFYTYQSTNLGDPLSININDIKITNTNSSIISATSNPKSNTTYIIYNNPNDNTIDLCNYNPITLFISCINADINDINTPTTTLNAHENNIQCRNNGGYLLTANNNTVFYYNQNINNIKNINCIFYNKRINNINQLLCLQLPSITLTNTNPQTTNSSGKINMPYDKIKFMSANDKFIIIMGCTNTLYYYTLENGFPNENNSWKVISSANLPIETEAIIDIKINDTTAFMYSRTLSASNSKIMYSPITLHNNNLILSWNNWIDGTDLKYSSMLLYGTTFTVNNDVLWFTSIDTLTSRIKCTLWWSNLTNGTPNITNNNITKSTWQNINIEDTVSNINNIFIFKNILAIVSPNKLITIELKTSTNNTNNSPTTSNTITDNNNNSPTTSNTITDNNNNSPTTTNTITGNTNNTPTTTNTITGNTNNTPTTINTISYNTNNSPTTTNTITDNNNSPTTTNTIADNTNNSPTTSNTISYNTNNSPTTSNTISYNTNNSPTTTTSTRIANDTTIPNTTNSVIKRMNNEYKGENGIISGMFGISGNTNNQDNLNDFLANTNVLGNNLYISPMNNQELYNPQQAKINGKISSSFFPMVRIS
jgi:hypothetical protein